MTDNLQVRPAETGKILPPVKAVTYKTERIVPHVLYISTLPEGTPRFESPIQRFGGPYDGAEASGWHVVLRTDEGTLESLSGPHEGAWAAAFALARLIAGEPA